jgi:hypothetical protein
MYVSWNIIIQEMPPVFGIKYLTQIFTLSYAFHYMHGNLLFCLALSHIRPIHPPYE